MRYRPLEVFKTRETSDVVRTRIIGALSDRLTEEAPKCEHPRYERTGCWRRHGPFVFGYRDKKQANMFLEEFPQWEGAEVLVVTAAGEEVAAVFHSGGWVDDYFREMFERAVAPLLAAAEKRERYARMSEAERVQAERQRIEEANAEGRAAARRLLEGFYGS